MSENQTTPPAHDGPTADEACGDIEKLLCEVMPAIASQVAAKHNYNITPATLEAINAAISRAWSEFDDSDKQVYIIADACKVSDVKFGIFQNEGYFQFETEFSPSPRYENGLPDCAPLGFFKNYDLYCLRQSSIPQALIARHGDNDEYISHDLHSLGAPAEATHEALREAFERALRANLFAGTTLAGNDGFGSFMIPELAVLEYEQTGSQPFEL